MHIFQQCLGAFILLSIVTVSVFAKESSETVVRYTIERSFPQDEEGYDMDINEHIITVFRGDQKIGDYLISNERSDEYITIFHDTQKVYAIPSIGWVQVKETAYRMRDGEFSTLPFGSDVTGNGIPDIVVTDSTFGGTCCTNTHIFEFGGQFHHLMTFSDFGHFEDLDGDQGFEYVTEDTIWGWWNEGWGYICAPFPTIIFHYNETLHTYQLAEEFMSRPTPSDDAVKLMITAIQETHESWRKDKPGPPNLLWETMIDLLYSGHERLAWSIFEQAWISRFGTPAEKEGWAFLFRKRLEQSRYWKHLNFK